MSTTPTPQADAFRPRTAVEVVDASIQLLRRHYGQFVLLALLMFPVIAVVLVAAALAALVEGVFGHGDGAVIGLVAGVVLLLLLASAWFMIVDAALSVAASEAYHARRVTAGGALRTVLFRGGAVVRGAILKGLILGLVLLGPIALAVADGLAAGAPQMRTVLLALIGIGMYTYLHLSYFIVPAVSVLESVGGAAGLGRSRTLARGNLLRVAGALALAWLLYLIGYTVAAVAVAMVPGLPDGLITALASACIFPLIPTVCTVLYYDLRIRNEGYDLALMTQSLDTAA